MMIFSFIGWSGSGKTTLITRLIERFRAQGRRVVAVKSTHAAYDLQPEGKDTARFLRAGAGEAYLLAGSELLRMTPLASAETWLAEMRGRLAEGDVVLLEGLTGPGIPVIEVSDGRKSGEPKAHGGELAAVVGPANNGRGRPCFHPDDIAGLGAFMEAYHGE